MQTEKSQPSGQRIMPETRLVSFLALSVKPRVDISLCASDFDVRFYVCLFVIIAVSSILKIFISVYQTASTAE